MARPRPTMKAPVGPLSSPLEDERRNKPSWLSLGGYFRKKNKSQKMPNKPMISRDITSSRSIPKWTTFNV